jgi:hypothetical protein
MAFSSDGELFFGGDGDLWQGSIALDQAQDGSSEIHPELDAVRSAPLATLETANGTPTQMGVSTIAIAKEMLYVHLSRLGGTGWGIIVRLRKPEKEGEVRANPNLPLDQEVENDLAQRLKLYGRETASVEILGRNGSLSYLCASPDGNRVFFTTNTALTPPDREQVREKKVYLIEDNG